MADKMKGVIAGVDTHKQFHVVALVFENGQRLGYRYFDADAKGYRQTYEWASSFGVLLRIGIEATGSYGAGLCNYLSSLGVECVDVYGHDKQQRRRRGKDDVEDAYQAAGSALAYERCAPAKKRMRPMRASAFSKQRMTRQYGSG